MDLVGTFLAIGVLFDPTIETLVLLCIAALTSVLCGAGLGVILGMLLPEKIWTRKIPHKHIILALLLLAPSISIISYYLRVGRNITPLPPRTEQSPTQAPRPPILWVVMDTLRADSLYGSSFDFPLAANIKRFAQDALIFKDAESSAGWTIPALATMFSGIHNTTIDASTGKLPLWVKTLPEYLYDAGYTTHALVDNVIVEPRAGFAQGFESYFQRSGFRFAFSLPAFRLLPRAIHRRLRAAFPTSYYGSPRLTDQALDVLEQEHARPLFLYVHYMDPHAPYHPHPELSPDPKNSSAIDYYEVRDRLRKEPGALPTPAQQLFLQHRYNTEITYMDKELGRLIESWENLYGQNSLILLTSDHGEEFLDHGQLGHGYTVHREMVHVPLLLKFPASDAQNLGQPRIVPEPVSQIDLLPSITDYLQIKTLSSSHTPKHQGRSFIPALKKTQSWEIRPMISSHGKHGKRLYRYRQGSKVYLKTMFYDKSADQKGLFDLTTDPNETNNLFADAVFKSQIDFPTMSLEFEQAARNLIRLGQEAPKQQVQDDHLESLRALGYID